MEMTEDETFRAKVGSEFQLQWPQLLGVLSITSTDQVQDLLAKNPTVTVTEKLDGSNLCLSSGGWIASRRRVILDNPTQHDLDKYKFCGVPLSSAGQLLAKVKLIAEDLKAYFSDRPFQVMLYGEWIQKGTSTSQVDKFKYADRNIRIGRAYTFGLGIQFAADAVGESQVDEIKRIFTEQLQWTVIDVAQPVRYFIICVNKKLQSFLQIHDVECVPILGELPFREVLSTDRFVKHLLDREYEGYVLSATDLILKWKAFDEDERTSQRDALTILENRLKDDSLKQVLATLAEVCNSGTPEDKQNLGPRRKPTKLVYAHLFNSAKSKFPTLDDYMDSESSSAEDNDKLLAIVKGYESTIYGEMAKDFVDAGYVLDDEYDKELRGNLRAKLQSEVQKKLKRKFNF